MKTLFEKLKIIWKNPGGRALLQIGLYCLFFGILFLLLNSKTSSKISDTVEEQYERWNQYSYTMTIQKENQMYHIHGSKAIEETFFVEEQNQTYQIVDEMIADENKNIVSEFDWSLLSPTKLSSFIQNGTINSTTSYKDGSKQIEYEMECNLWNPSLEGVCQFTTIQKENQMVQVNLDVVDLYRVEIHYQNDSQILES